MFSDYNSMHVSSPVSSCFMLQGTLIRKCLCLAFLLIDFLLQTALVSPNEKQFDLLQQRLGDRLQDGRGETIFDVGVGEGR
jgi:hypothetical protein